MAKHVHGYNSLCFLRYSFFNSLNRNIEITNLLEKWEEDQKKSVEVREMNPRVSVFGDVSTYLEYTKRSFSVFSLESVGRNREAIMEILTNEGL